MASCKNITSNKNSSNSWYGDYYDKVTDYVGGHSRSILISVIDLLPIKPESPFSTALLKHYLEKSGRQLNLSDIADIPKEWKDFIVNTTRGQLGAHKINPYNSGFFDLRNSLGHFDVHVTRTSKNQSHYNISDYYAFGYFKNDTAQKGRHGFPLGNLPEDQISVLRGILPDETYCNPGGFYEKWEITHNGSETILYIPQEYLTEAGKPYNVIGSFTQ